jgi:UDP-N-acetylmuramate--alanine ligase
VLYHWGSFERLVDAFRQFLSAVPGPRVVCVDDPLAAQLAVEAGSATTYGTDPEADYVIDQVDGRADGVRFRVSHEGAPLGTVDLPEPGVHNARNATAALVVAVESGVPFADAAAALAEFGGVARRFEHRGEAGGVTFVDDYAHLPTEVRAALQAARSGDWRRVVAVFQPHRFTRTAEVWADFATAFADADAVAITEVYAAGETPIEGVTGKLVVGAILDAEPFKQVAWVPSLADATTWLRGVLRPGDLCLTLGAGDITSLADQVLPHLARPGG